MSVTGGTGEGLCPPPDLPSPGGYGPLDRGELAPSRHGACQEHPHDPALRADAGGGQDPRLEGEVVRSPFVVEPEDAAVAADELHVDEVVGGRAVDVRPGRERRGLGAVAAGAGA